MGLVINKRTCLGICKADSVEYDFIHCDRVYSKQNFDKDLFSLTSLKKDGNKMTVLSPIPICNFTFCLRS